SEAGEAGNGRVNEPLLIDANELKDLCHAAPGPFLVLVQNNEAGRLVETFGPMDPLWEAWKYSIWKVPVSRQHSALSNRVQRKKGANLGIRSQADREGSPLLTADR
ncbi:MAG: hypothetical protein ACRD3O_23060, partial [Terriglobia bacterium]